MIFTIFNKETQQTTLMKELIIGILDFRKRLRPRVLELFQKMAQGQSVTTWTISI
jgi:hypothetical protein